uniref:Uncharacterized protein n=1 Tax=Octopus bimaculoides TaxID=37653 RepID=A0A0L8IC03_OCTBM
MITTTKQHFILHFVSLLTVVSNPIRYIKWRAEVYIRRRWQLRNIPRYSHHSLLSCQAKLANAFEDARKQQNEDNLCEDVYSKVNDLEEDCYGDRVNDGDDDYCGEDDWDKDDDCVEDDVDDDDDDDNDDDDDDDDNDDDDDANEEEEEEGGRRGGGW